MYWANLAFVLGALGVLAGSGWWAISPFQHHLGAPLAAAPLAGMVLVSLATLFLMVGLHLGVGVAATLGIGALCAASLASRYVNGPTRIADWRVLLAASVTVSAVAVWFMTRADLFFGVPGLVYAHGTDHLGYAHIADWLRLFPRANVNPTPDPSNWYGSWPQAMFLTDPRFGAFTFLAVVATFSGRSGAFAYDLASAVVLSAAALGVAGLYSRSRLTFAVLAVGVFTSFWFDWNRTGYLGKTLAYPGILLVAALFFAWVGLARREEPFPLVGLAATAAITAGVAVMFSGLVSALFVGLLGSVFLAVRAVHRWVAGTGALRDLDVPVVALGLLMGLSILSSGIIARPLYFGNASLPWSWPEVLVRAAEVEGLLAARSGLSPEAIWALTMSLLVTTMVLAVLATVQGRPAAAALLIGPLLLLAWFYVADLRWIAMNFIGLYVPLILCGTCTLVDTPAAGGRLRWLRFLVLSLMIVLVASHLPRFAATAAFHGGADTPPLFRFSSAETEALASVIRREGGMALVDVGQTPHFAIFLLVELGRRGIPLQWSAQSWRSILGYRPWPVPTYAEAAPLEIVLRTDDRPGTGVAILRTTQFELRRRP